MPAAPFTFVRLKYHSGDWDAVDERMPANLLHSLVQYTKVAVDPKEKWWRWIARSCSTIRSAT